MQFWRSAYQPYRFPRSNKGATIQFQTTFITNCCPTSSVHPCPLGDTPTAATNKFQSPKSVTTPLLSSTNSTPIITASDSPSFDRSLLQDDEDDAGDYKNSNSTRAESKRGSTATSSSPLLSPSSSPPSQTMRTPTRGAYETNPSSSSTRFKPYLAKRALTPSYLAPSPPQE